MFYGGLFIIGIQIQSAPAYRVNDISATLIQSLFMFAMACFCKAAYSETGVISEVAMQVL